MRDFVKLTQTAVCMHVLLNHVDKVHASTVMRCGSCAVFSGECVSPDREISSATGLMTAPLRARCSNGCHALLYEPQQRQCFKPGTRDVHGPTAALHSCPQMGTVESIWKQVNE